MTVMKESLLREDLVLLDYEADNQEELLTNLGQILVEKGYVKPSYIEGLIKREEVYPTGLNTKGVQIAIPHTDFIHVNETAVLIAKLRNPVAFKEMANDPNEVNAKIIFMIAVKEPKKQVKMLSKLMEVFSNDEKLMKLANSEDKREIIDILS